MLAKHQQQLDLPYASSSQALDDRFGDALGVGVAHLRTLRDAIFDDLDENTYGIRWWSGYPLGDKARICISDHLFECAATVETNIIEAKLHLLELEDYDQRTSDFTRFSIVLDGQGRPVPPLRLPPRVTPADDLPERMSALHLAGFFRAIGTVLDCLGCVVIGVLALPRSLLKGSLAVARDELDRVAKQGPSTSGEALQVAFAAKLESMLAAAGPPGWSEWALDYRNMLVHRGRRLSTAEFCSRGGVVLDPSGHPVTLSKEVRHVPSDPNLSDVEALVDARAPVLMEDSWETLSGILRSVIDFVGGTGRELEGVWRQRRNNPKLLEQPPRQWPLVPSSGAGSFPGYKPSTRRFSPDILTGNPRDLHRWKCAAVLDPDRAKWSTFT